MKAYSVLLASLFVITSAVPARASQGKILYCEMVNLINHRIQDWKEAPIVPGGADDAILLLLGISDVMGTVRDVPGMGASDRKLVIELSYRQGVVSGKATGSGEYRLDRAASTEPLAEVSIEGPEFGEVTGLSCFLRDA